MFSDPITYLEIKVKAVTINFSSCVSIMMIFVFPSQDNIVDSKSNITIMATVQQNPLRPLSASNGQPPIVDLDPDFRIRIPTPTSTEVSVTADISNCNDVILVMLLLSIKYF